MGFSLFNSPLCANPVGFIVLLTGVLHIVVSVRNTSLNVHGYFIC